MRGPRYPRACRGGQRLLPPPDPQPPPPPPPTGGADAVPGRLRAAAPHRDTTTPGTTPGTGPPPPRLPGQQRRVPARRAGARPAPGGAGRGGVRRPPRRRHRRRGAENREGGVPPALPAAGTDVPWVATLAPGAPRGVFVAAGWSGAGQRRRRRPRGDSCPPGRNLGRPFPGHLAYIFLLDSRLSALPLEAGTSAPSCLPGTFLFSPVNYFPSPLYPVGESVSISVCLFLLHAPNSSSVLPL